MNRTRVVAELDCVDVREALFAGRPLSAAEAEHAAGCPVCSQALPDGESPGSSAELFAELETAVREEKGLAAKLRSLPTPTRLATGAAIAFLCVGGTVLARPRWAYGPMPLEHVVSVVGVLAGLFGLVLWLSLRPLQAAPVSRTFLLGTVAAGLAAPMLFALMPIPEVAVVPLVGPGVARSIVSCFLFGACSGAPLLVVLWALDRGAHRAADIVLLAAVSGGLAGNAALELHCPSASVMHRLFGHATVGVVLVLIYVAIRRSRRDDPMGVRRTS